MYRGRWRSILRTSRYALGVSEHSESTKVASEAARGRGGSCTATAAKTVSLKVHSGGAGAKRGTHGGGDGHGAVKKSRASKWRAATLIAVHAIILAHVVQWLVQGVTVSPVEPSESMFTLETGEVNAGFIFFAVAIASTLIFGRYFCGWGCHVVALQDLCSHLMNKIGIRPKPFRSRLLVWVPVVLAFYMFAWPTVRRELVQPGVQSLANSVVPVMMEWAGMPTAMVRAAGEVRISLPYWMGQVAPFPGFRNGVMVEDFWATFPPWYVAIPFLLACGFGAVYFLGSKGFCTYGCPYGGIFGPVDRFSPGRIVVNDNCEGCGHCTAVCTSNVRVHQEVRDFGMVVDPGCMKCMDCVSVCPNNALSFGFARPPVLAKARTAEAKAGKVRRPEYDMGLGEEVVFFGVGVGIFACYRGMLDQVPLLMAVAMAGMLTFCLWKLWRMVRVANVRVHDWQLRSRGKLTRAGAIFAACTLLALGAALWSGTVRFHRFMGENIDAKIETPQQVVFAPGYVPSPVDKARAERALAWLTRADTPERGGVGWGLTPALNARVAWLAAVAGDRARAEAALVRGLTLGMPSEDVVLGLRELLALRGAAPAEFQGMLDRALAEQPEGDHARVARGFLAMALNDRDGARAQFDAILARGRHAGDLAQVRAVQGLLSLGEVEQATSQAERMAAAFPNSFMLRDLRANIALQQRDMAGGLRWLREAAEREPHNPVRWRQVADLARQAGTPADVEDATRRAERAERRMRGG